MFLHIWFNGELLLKRERDNFLLQHITWVSCVRTSWVLGCLAVRQGQLSIGVRCDDDQNDDSTLHHWLLSPDQWVH